MTDEQALDRACYSRDSIPEERGWAHLEMALEEAAEPEEARWELEGNTGDEARLAELPAATEEPLEDLPDAFHASFGFPTEMEATFPAAAEARDEAAALRPLVDGARAPSTKDYPHRTVAHLRVHALTGRTWGATGFLVGRSVLLTAGHAVFLQGHGGWAARVDVIPGRDGSSIPFGTYHSQSFASVDGWTLYRDANYDYGAIFLDQPIGNQLGTLGLHAPRGRVSAGTDLRLAGYPARDGGVPTRLAGPAAADNGLRLYYHIAAAVGHSGSPVRLRGRHNPSAIHVYQHRTRYSGVRIRPTVIRRVRDWIR